MPLTVIFGFGFWLKSDSAARFAGTTIQAIAEAALGEEVTIGGVTVSFVPLEVGLEGVVIAHRADGERIVGVRSVHARFGVQDWQAGLVRLTIDSPDVHLHLDADGLREFRDAAKGSGKKLNTFPWMELVITNGRALVEGEDLRVELSGLEVAPEPEGKMDVAFGRLSVDRGAIHEASTPTRFKHVVLTPHSVNVPALDLRMDHLSLDGTLAVDADGPLLGDLALRAALPGFTQNAADPRKIVEGVVDADLHLDGTIHAPVVDARVASEGIVWWRVNSHDERLALDLGRVVGPLHFEGHTLTAGTLKIPWGEGQVEVSAVLDTETKELSADVLGEGLHLGRILRQTGGFANPWIDFPADVETHVKGQLSPFGLAGPFEVDVSDLLVRNGPYDSKASEMLTVPAVQVLGDLSLDAEHILLDVDRLVAGPGHGTAHADIGFASWGPLNVRTDLRDFDLAWLQPLGGAGLGGRAHIVGTLEGRFDNLHATADIDAVDAEVLQFALADTVHTHLESDLHRLEFTAIDGQIGDSHYLGNYTLAFLPEGMWMDTQLAVPEGRARDLIGIFVDLRGIDGRVTGNALLHGPPRRLSGEVHLELDDFGVYGEKFEGGVATAWMDDGVLTIDDLSLRRGAESVLVRGSVGHQYAMNVEILTDGLRLETLDHLQGIPVAVSGDVVGDVRVGGTLFDWEPRGRLAVQRTQVQARNVEDSVVRFTTDAKGLLSWKAAMLGKAARADGHLQIHGEQPYDLHADFDTFPVHVLYPDGADGTPVEATLSGELDLAGHFGADPTPVDIEARFPAVHLAWNHHDLKNDGPWSMAVHGKSVQIPPFTLTDGDRTKLVLQGWSTGDGRTSFKGGGTLDLDLARMFAPGIPLAEGTGNLDVAFGTDAGPTGVQMRLTTKNATLRTDYFPNTFTGVKMDVTTDGTKYTLSDVSADVGGGRLTGGGTIGASGWWPSRFDLHAELRDARVQYLDYLPPMVGNADLRFDGPVGDLLMSGTIDIADMEFRDRVDWEAKIVALQASRLTDGASASRKDYFSMDLGVTAHDTVRLRNNLADATASADLRIVGDTARPGMTGTIVLDPGGRMYLKDREFEVARGELRYLDPYTYDPDLDIQLETDVAGREQTYHVDYSVTGPFSDWTTTTSSDPYLAQADINTLLLFGMTREEFEQYGGGASAIAAQATDLIAAQVAANPVQLVDRWNLVTGISARGTPTLDSNWRVVAEKDFLGFTATGELDLADYDLYLSVERRVARSFFASVYTTSQEEGRSLDVGAAFGTELKYRWELD